MRGAGYYGSLEGGERDRDGVDLRQADPDEVLGDGQGLPRAVGIAVRPRGGRPRAARAARGRRVGCEAQQ